MHLTAAKGHMQILAVLHKYSSDVNARAGERLHLHVCRAAGDETSQSGRLLTKNSAKMDLFGDNRKCPLHVLVQHSFDE